MTKGHLAGLPAGLTMWCLIVPIVACDSGGPGSGMTGPSAVTPPPVATLSGQVFDITPEGRIPVADMPIWVVINSGNCPAPTCSSQIIYEPATTGPDGRYHFPRLPFGAAFVFANSATHRQVCGAPAVLGGATQVDVEITSRSNPRPSPTLPPLRVTGQVYETTPAGRVGIDGALVYTEWIFPDLPFVEFYADRNGHYAACGIPPNTRIAVSTWHEEFEETYGWHQFSGDTTLDIELKRR